jgi:hypothetical protein
MTGSHAAQIVIPIIALILLAFWLSLIYYADAHPYWRGRHPPAQQGIDMQRLAQVPLARPGDGPVQPVQLARVVPGQRLPLRETRRPGPTGATAAGAGPAAGATAAGQGSSARVPPGEPGARTRRTLATATVR